MTFWLTAATTAAVFVAAWALSVRLRDASIIDIVWGPGFGVIALVAFLAGDGSPARRALVLALAGVWGLRLGFHIGRRNRGGGEDYRYAAMRERHGERFPLVSLWRVFLLQAAVQWVVSLPLQVAAGYEGPLGWVEWLAAAIWAESRERSSLLTDLGAQRPKPSARTSSTRSAKGGSPLVKRGSVGRGRSSVSRRPSGSRPGRAIREPSLPGTSARGSCGLRPGRWPARPLWR